MSDLIERESLKSELIKKWNISDDHDFANKDVWEVVEGLPSAEPEIIRCKDCKHRVVNEGYGKRGYLRIRAYCELDSGDIFALGRNADEDDWFCADAELIEESKGGE